VVSRIGAIGAPIGWSIDGANRDDVFVLEPTLGAAADNGLFAEIGTVTLDRTYDYPGSAVNSTLAGSSSWTFNAAAPGPRAWDAASAHTRVSLGG
jgi:hypothetical protein